MKLYLSVLLLLNFSNLYSQPQYISPANLNWQDYRGIVKYDSGFLAYTFCKVFIAFDKNFKDKAGIEIGIKFYPDSSWVDWQSLSKIPSTFTDTLFKHEILHYYIGILVFKKLKIAFAKFNFIDLHNEYKNLNEGIKYFSPFADMQKALNTEYDTETSHGSDRKKQKSWNDFIMRSVDSLKDVKITPNGN